MPRYVAFFGSINVGGNRLTMADLRAAFEAEDFANVETVVASGNVLFDFDERPTAGLEDLFAHMMIQEVLATPRLGDVLHQLSALGHRVDVGVDAAHGNALGRRHSWGG